MAEERENVSIYGHGHLVQWESRGPGEATAVRGCDSRVLPTPHPHSHTVSSASQVKMLYALDELTVSESSAMVKGSTRVKGWVRASLWARPAVPPGAACTSVLPGLFTWHRCPAAVLGNLTKAAVWPWLVAQLVEHSPVYQ